MRIVIVSNDTRGGIQPYVALGQGLHLSGHEVTVVAPADYGPMLDDAGLDHAPLSGGVEDLLRSAAGAGERGTLAAMRLAGREMAPRIVTWTRETLEASEGADILTGGIGGKVVGLAVADRLGVPFVEAHLQPVGAPTAAYPGALFGSLPGWIEFSGIHTLF